MSQFFYIHPDNPQQRLINQAVDIVRKGGVIVYPTDSGYALGCKIEDKGAMERICRIRHLPDGHNFTLMCRDLSELSTYSYVDNVAFRLMKNNTPGNYTFILKGTKEVPRRLLQEKRKTIGLRVPSNPIALALLDTLGEPMLSTSLMLPGSDFTVSYGAGGSPESRRGFALTIASKNDNNTALFLCLGDAGVNPIFYLLLALLITFITHWAIPGLRPGWASKVIPVLRRLSSPISHR